MKVANQKHRAFKQSTAAALVVAVASFAFSSNTHADTAAGVTLTNTVTVDYTDAGGTAQTQLTASVDVTVDHVAAVAWGTAPADQVADSGGTLPGPYTITLTNEGNGLDNYSIADNTTESCTSGSLSAESFSFITPVELGASVLSAQAAAAATVLVVPNDGTDDSISRGIAVGDTIVISSTGETAVVTAVDESGASTNMTVDTDEATAGNQGISAIAPAGTQIGERIDFEYGDTGTAGTTSGGPSGCEHQHELVATGTTATGGNTQSTDTVNGFVTTVEGVEMTVAKYVRNVTDTAKNNGAADFTYDGNGYFESGDVTGNPGDTLEYLVVIDNSTSGASGNDVIFNDTLPAFTTYTDDTLALDSNGDGTFDRTTGPVAVPGSIETEGTDDGVMVVSGSVITVYAGVGGDDNAATPAGGVIAAGEDSAVRYQVTID